MCLLNKQPITTNTNINTTTVYVYRRHMLLLLSIFEIGYRRALSWCLSFRFVCISGLRLASADALRLVHYTLWLKYAASWPMSSVIGFSLFFLGGPSSTTKNAVPAPLQEPLLWSVVDLFIIYLFTFNADGK